MVATAAVGRNWKETFSQLSIRSASAELRIISCPYVTRDGVDFVLSNLPDAIRDNGRISFVTNLSPANICQGATDPLRFLAFTSACGKY